MSTLDFYAVVNISMREDVQELGIAGKVGVVVGHSHGQEGDLYAVLIDGEAYMVPESALVPTGEVLDRHAVYTGESLGVPAERYADEEEARHE